ncbi:MAG: hypothetical protein R3181_08815 [Rubricoccaceae bacterium]|nr:hypothetical protein [Rubricoccaceae bacterium]
MMKRNVSLALIAVLLVALGCGPSEEERRQQEMEEAAERLGEAAEQMGEAASGDLASAMEAMGEAMSGSGEGSADPVDFRRLKEVLPAEAAGLQRTSHTGERTGAMGMTFSQAEADYEGDDGARVDVKVMDLAGVPTFGMLGFAWTMAEMDRETDTGYERTMTYRGHRGYEKYDSADRSGEMQLIVADRFAVEARGRNVDMDRIQAVVDDIGLRELEGMRNEGR